jgi:hypothetical protein
LLSQIQDHYAVLAHKRFNFGSLSVEIYPSSGGLTVDILDTTTGEQTQVIIPN